MAHRLLKEAIAILSSEPEGSKEAILVKKSTDDLKRIEKAILLGSAGMRINSLFQLG